MECPDKLNLKYDIGNYEYKIVGVVDAVSSNHVVAKVKLEDGNRYCINDLGDGSVKKIHFDTNNPMRKMIFYERIGQNTTSIGS